MGLLLDFLGTFWGHFSDFLDFSGSFFTFSGLFFYFFFNLYQGHVKIISDPI